MAQQQWWCTERLGDAKLLVGKIAYLSDMIAARVGVRQGAEDREFYIRYSKIQ